jgi:UDP-N-acetylmuramoyl-tripeptide--D-alanyl-D-alanine ligase
MLEAALILLYVSWLLFILKRLLTYTHALQQEEYDSARFVQWIFTYRVFDKRLSLALFITALMALLVHPVLSVFLVFFCLLIAAYTEKDPRKHAKKKLASTPRAKRVFFASFAVLALLGLPCFFVATPLFWLIAVQLVPFVLALVNYMVKPLEESFQRKFWDDAHRKIMRLAPKTIAITGSFGKTSVKHILGHILKTQAPTLITPGSVNTPMGIARIVRENLDESHRYFVVEMGAYGPGSIARLCALTPPDMGLITAVGQAHYERFKSLETVAAAKFELAQAVINRGGKVIVQTDTLRFASTQKMRAEHADHFVVCGKDDLKIDDIVQHITGLTLWLSWKGGAYTIDVPLFGLHHGYNVALAFAAAVELGIEPDSVITALKSVPQIAHRLEVKKQAGGTTLIDDAFNSNPDGFRAALELLPILKGGGRAILITPGMVELGDAHAAAHSAIGKLAGQICDIALVVQAARIPTFVGGFHETGPDKTLVEFATFQEAAAWLDQNKKPGDVILIENDLPDIYERIPAI